MYNVFEYSILSSGWHRSIVCDGDVIGAASILSDALKMTASSVRNLTCCNVHTRSTSSSACFTTCINVPHSSHLAHLFSSTFSIQEYKAIIDSYACRLPPRLTLSDLGISCHNLCTYVLMHLYMYVLVHLCIFEYVLMHIYALMYTGMLT